jgi:hypothetical protein
LCGVSPNANILKGIKFVRQFYENQLLIPENTVQSKSNYPRASLSTEFVHLADQLHTEGLKILKKSMAEEADYSSRAV